ANYDLLSKLAPISNHFFIIASSTTVVYTISLHDALPIYALKGVLGAVGVWHLKQGPRSGGTAFNFLHHHVGNPIGVFRPPVSNIDRKSTRLNSSTFRSRMPSSA